MTITDDPRDTRDIPRDTLSDKEARIRLQEEWRVSGGTLTAAEGAARFGRTERWARKWIGLARSEGEQPPVPAERPKPVPTVPDRKLSKVESRREPRKRNVPEAAPVALRVVNVGAGVVVAAVVAVVSYMHIQHLAAHVGMGSQSWWLPLGIDGMVIVCSSSLIVDRGRRRSGLAWVGCVVGFAGSLAANAIAVEPTLASAEMVRIVLACYPPVALVVTGHVLLRMLGDR